jgi:hypothetical protein
MALTTLKHKRRRATIALAVTRLLAFLLRSSYDLIDSTGISHGLLKPLPGVSVNAVKANILSRSVKGKYRRRIYNNESYVSLGRHSSRRAEVAIYRLTSSALDFVIYWESNTRDIVYQHTVGYFEFVRNTQCPPNSKRQISSIMNAKRSGKWL